MELLLTSVVEYNVGEDEDLPDYLFRFELDSSLNVDSKGKAVTRFSQKVPCYLRANYSTNVTIKRVVSTDGSLRSLGSSSRTEEQLFLFQDVKAPTVFRPSYRPSNVSFSYVGRRGSVEKKSLGSGMVEYHGSTGLVPFLARANISFPCDIFQLVPPNFNPPLGEDDSYPIGVVAYIEVN